MRVDLAGVLPLGAFLLVGCQKPFNPDPPLRVERVTPRAGGQVLLNQEIRVDFNTGIDPTSVTQATFKILDERGNAVHGRPTIRSRSITFEPRPPLLPDLSDGSFQPDRVYRLVVTGFPLTNSVRSATGRILEEGFSREFRTVPLSPLKYPSPLLPVGLGIEPFRLRLEGSLSREIAAGSGRLQIQFSLPVLPTSLSREGFELQILRVSGTRETLTPATAELRSFPQPIDPYPGCTVELWLGDVGLVPGDLVAVRLTGGVHALRDYQDRELEPDLGIPLRPWTVVEGHLAEWPQRDETFQPVEEGGPSFAAGPDGIRPRLFVEAGGGGLGRFRPVRDTVLRPGVPFDLGDGESAVSQGPQFEFLTIDIPPGVTVRVEAGESVRILCCGSIRIAGTLELAVPAGTTYLPFQRVPCAVLLRDSGLSLLAAGDIAVTGSVRYRGPAGTDTSPLSLVAGGAFDLRGPIPPQTVVANRLPQTGLTDPSGRITGAAESFIPVLVTSMTEGLPPGAELTLEAWSSWQGIPFSHTGPMRVAVEPEPLADSLEVLLQVAPPDPLDPARPDRRSDVLEQPRSLASIQDGFDVPPGGFVRVMLWAHVVAGQPLPAVHKIQVLAN